MSTDKPTRLWNRRFFGWLFGIGAVAIVAIVYVWVIWGDRIDDLVWGIRHDHTAQFEGHEMRLPRLWKQTEQPAGQHTFSIETSFTQSSLTADVRVHLGPSSKTAAERIESAREGMYRVHGATPELTLPWRDDASLTSHYSCLMTPDPFLNSIELICFSNTSGWSFFYSGDKSRLPDAETILRNLIAWEQPKK